MPFASLATWLTSPWLLAAGVSVGVVILALAWGIVWLLSRRAGEALAATLREGFLGPLFGVALLLSLFALVGLTLVPVGDFWRSLAQLTRTNEGMQSLAVPDGARDELIELPQRPAELARVEIESDQDVIFRPQPKSERVVLSSDVPLEVRAGEVWTWTRGAGPSNPFSGESTTVYVTNRSGDTANVAVHALALAAYPEVATIPITAVCFVGLVGLYLLVRFTMPKLAAIASATTKEAIAQPLYLILLGLGGFLILIFVIIPYNTFGEDVKMLKDTGLVLIMLLAILTALWTASVSVAEEIEGRTALTVLSKPVGRRQFVLGKFVGIVWPVALMFIVLGIWFLFWVSYKVVYDSRESALPEPTWRDCYVEMIGIVPGLALAFMEAVVLAAISVAISTRLPMLPNLLICASIYALGHLLPMLVKSGVRDPYGIVQFTGRLFATILPVLEHFNIQAAVAAGASVPLNYLGWALLYCVTYSAVAMLLALFLFEDRDLA
jgi:ABC-type transport system involved in multi-copper enzyme maturation permease subunit